MAAVAALESPRYQIKTPRNLSPRLQWLRDYYFQGMKRAWSNGTPWDFQ